MPQTDILDSFNDELAASGTHVGPWFSTFGVAYFVLMENAFETSPQDSGLDYFVDESLDGVTDHFGYGVPYIGTSTTGGMPTRTFTPCAAFARFRVVNNNLVPYQLLYSIKAVGY